MEHINWLGFVALFIFLIWIFPNVRNISSKNKLVYAVIWLVSLIVLMLVYSYFFAPEFLPFDPNKPSVSI